MATVDSFDCGGVETVMSSLLNTAAPASSHVGITHVGFDAGGGGFACWKWC